MKWKKQNRKLEKGDIIRTKVSNKEHKKYGEYIYSICSGSGFGCSMETMGNAIFVYFEGFDLEEVKSKLKIVMNKKADDIKYYDKYLSPNSSRWERFWGIEILEEEVMLG